MNAELRVHMSNPKLDPDKVTSPIQLMAAWFVMLILLTGVLLTAAVEIEKPVWAAGYLVIFSSAVILLVVGCVLLMLTKFRPNLQDGIQYSEWLKDQNKYSQGLIREESEEKNGQILASIKESISFKQYINVSIASLPDSSMISDIFNDLGYQSEIYVSPGPDEEETNHFAHEAVWLGAKVPVQFSVEILKQAFRVWPHLKYIHLSNDSEGPEHTHRSVFLGGSTSTAVGRFKLTPWNLKEIEALDESMNLEDFHRLVRSKYP